jgi:type I restriction enzyme S subunit
VRAFRSANVLENRVNDKDWVYLSKEGHAANSKSILRTGDLLVVRSGAPGTACVVPPEFDGTNCIDIVFARPNTKLVIPEYLCALTNSSVGRRHVQGNQGGLALQHFNVGAFKRMQVLLPSLPEQRKIGEILRTWDEAIEKLDTLIGQMKQASSAVNRSIFEAEYTSRGHLLRARDIFETVSERARPDLPLLAVMQDIGVVRRDELDRRVAMPDGDTSTYKVVRPGDFVISLRSFEGGLEYSEVLGLVSPAYTVLRPIRKIDTEYYRHFFKSRSFVGRLDKMIFGIRDGKQIAFRDFGDMRIPSPSIDNQVRRSRLLGTTSEIVRANLRRKQALERQRRGLTQKLLTGEWLVKV